MKKKLLLLALIPLVIYGQVAFRPPKPGDKDILKLGWTYEQGETPAVKFRIYYGTKSGEYLNKVETDGLENTINLELAAGEYYFTATAIAADGLESFQCPEIKHTIAARPNVVNGLTSTRITIFVD